MALASLSDFVAYITQSWSNAPDESTPISASRLKHIEDGIGDNSDAIELLIDKTSEIDEKTSEIETKTSEIEEKTSELEEKTSEIEEKASDNEDKTSELAEKVAQNTSAIETLTEKANANDAGKMASVGTTYTGTMEDFLRDDSYLGGCYLVTIGTNATGFPTNSTLGIYMVNSSGTRRTLILPSRDGGYLYLINYHSDNDVTYQTCVELTTVETE